MSRTTGRTSPAGRDAANRVEAVERALSLLDAFGEGSEALSLAELAARTRLYKSTILRLAGSLEHFGYLRREKDGIFRLGPAVLRLGTIYRRSFNLGDHVRPELRRLVALTQETASFYVHGGAERICLYCENSPRPVRHHLEEGVRHPLDKGAGGRVLLAFAGTPGEPYATIRAEGSYVSLGERDPEIAAASVPVFDEIGRFKGALAVSSLITRFDFATQQAALAALRESAGRLRRVLPHD